MKKYLSSYWIRSAFFTFLQRFSLTFFGLVNFMILIRSFSNEHAKMGTWALFLIVTAMFETSKTNLVKNAHIKFFTGTDQEKEKIQIGSSALVLNCLFTLVAVAFFWLSSTTLARWLNAESDLPAMLLAFIPGMLALIPFSHFECTQQANLDFKGVFIGYFVRQASFFVVLVGHLLLHEPYTLAQLALYQSGSILLGSVVLFFQTKKYLHFQFLPTMRWIKQLLQYGSFIFSSGLMAMLCGNLDQLMTARFLAPASVAYYNAASRINQMIDIPSYAASEILFPKVSEASALTGADRVRFLYEKMVGVLLCFTVPASLFVICFPNFVITLIAGPGYGASAIILQLYMLTGILRPVQHQAANVLNSIGKPRLCFILNTGFLAVYLVINYFCLKQFGFYGAVIGSVITSVIGLTAWYIVLKKEIDFRWGSILQYSLETYRTIFLQMMAFTGKTKSRTA